MIVAPEFNEEDVDGAHGSEKQRLDCDRKTKEDRHLGWNKVSIRSCAKVHVLRIRCLRKVVTAR